MPGMTANASFYVTEKKNIVLMPAKALNFNPNRNELQAYQQAHPETQLQTPNTKPDDPDSKEKIVWVKNGDSLHQQKVTLGDTNELFYEILSGLKVGDEVVIAMNQSTGAKTVKTEVKSPFMPQRPGSKKKTK